MTTNDDTGKHKEESEGEQGRLGQDEDERHAETPWCPLTANITLNQGSCFVPQSPILEMTSLYYQHDYQHSTTTTSLVCLNCGK